MKVEGGFEENLVGEGLGRRMAEGLGRVGGECGGRLREGLRRRWRKVEGGF